MLPTFKMFNENS